MNFERTIRRLNRRFGEEFGFTDAGEPYYKWIETNKMFAWLVDTQAQVQLPSGIWIPSTDRLKRIAWSEVANRGKRWALAVWSFIPRSEWEIRYEGKLEWPGEKQAQEYHLIENVMLDPGEVPTWDTTTYAIWCIREDRKKTFHDHWLEGEKIVEKQKDDVVKSIEDEFDDAVPTFAPRSFGGVGESPITTRKEWLQ